MRTEWLTPEDFFTKESENRGVSLNKDALDYLCAKYDVEKMARDWAKPKEVKRIPDVWNGKFHENTPSINRYFDHFYSLKTKNGKIYWVVCPYDCGWTMKQIKDAFKENYVKCDILPGFYAHFTIVLDPEALVEACYDYVVEGSGQKNNPWAVYRVSDKVYPSVKKLRTFDTEKKAVDFVKEIDRQRKLFVA